MYRPALSALIIGTILSVCASAEPARIAPTRANKKPARPGTKPTFEPLSFEQYKALHDGRRPQGLNYVPRKEFIIDHVGSAVERHFSDLGIEYYRYVG